MGRTAAEKRTRGLRDPKVQLAIALIVIATTGLFFYLSYLPDTQIVKLQIDWRTKLQIADFRSNTNSTPPAGIGTPWGQFWFNHTYDRLNGTWLGPEGYAPLNTRDNTGSIYVQSTVCCPAYIFTLGYFFSEWGQHLNKTCVMDYCYSPGETVVYDVNNDNLFGTGDPVIYAAGNNAPASNTPLSSDTHLRFIDVSNTGSWSSGDPIIYNANSNGVYDNGDILVTVSEPLKGLPLSTDSKIKFVDSNSDGTYNWPVPPVVLESNHDTTRCDPSVLGLAGGYEWTIWEWRPTISLAANCFPTSGV